MTPVFKQIIESIKELSADEKALVAHCLITSLETKQDDGTDDAWAELVEKRYLELESGSVSGKSWQQIKNEVTGQDV